MILGLKQRDARRFAASTNVGGVVTPGAVTDFTILATIQPLDPKTREAIDGGFVARAQYRMFTRAELRTVDTSEKTQGDRVYHKGRWLEVLGGDDWSEAPVLAHHEYILLKPEADS